VSPLVAAVIASDEGLLVLLAAGEERFLLASAGCGGLALDAGLIARTLSACDGPSATPSDDEIARATHAVQSWIGHWAGRRRLAMASRSGARCRARVARRITELLAATPRHERAGLAAAASAARRTLAHSLGAGAESALVALAAARRFDARTIDEIAELSKGRRLRSLDAGEPAPLAMIVLRRADRD